MPIVLLLHPNHTQDEPVLGTDQQVIVPAVLHSAKWLQSAGFHFHLQLQKLISPFSKKKNSQEENK